MTFWHGFNTRLYGAYYRLRHRPHPRPAVQVAPADDKAVLYVAWGRIGDAVLSTGVLRHLRRAFSGCRIVYAGRPETRPIAEPYVDTFVGLDAIPQRAYECIIGDIHLFYGGTHQLGGLLAALPAERKFVYEGYFLGAGLVPTRIYPRGFDVVPALSKPGEFQHVLHDHAHYFREVTRRWSGEAFAGDLTPTLTAEPEPGYEDCIAWQPVSNNPKKDYPLARWREVLAAFPERTFVALGTAIETTGLDLPNVRDLCGKTDLAGALRVIAGARGFLGLDSGLTHAAAWLGRPTVCVTQSSNLGYFFPYPPEYGRENLKTVDHPDFRICSGCFMTCKHESILSTYVRGSKCLRELSSKQVIEAVGTHLASPAPSPVTA